jgi:hypothetical protein
MAYNALLLYNILHASTNPHSRESGTLLPENPAIEHFAFLKTETQKDTGLIENKPSVDFQ